MKPGASKVQWVVAASVVVAAAGAMAGYALSRTRAVPDGQRPLLSLAPTHLPELKRAFNEGVGHPRVIAFLSPT
jgi:hypothetical protein